MMVEDTARMCKKNLSASRYDESEEHRARIFHGLVLRGEIRTAVLWVTEHKKRGGGAAKGRVHQDRLTCS